MEIKCGSLVVDQLEVPVQCQADIATSIVSVVACTVRVLLVLCIEEVVYAEGEAKSLTATEGL